MTVAADKVGTSMPNRKIVYVVDDDHLVLEAVQGNRPVTFSFPPIAGAADAAKASAALLAAVSAGEITPSEAAESREI